jgi:hypothetical protein
MDLGAWLRSLGLERYEAAFRDNAIAADVLRELTDQDLEKIGVLLGDRRRLLRAIATLDETAATPTSPAPAPTTAKSTPATTAPSPVSAVVEVSGERPNVVTLRANQPELLKADAKERFTLEDAIRQATETTGKARTEAAAETRTRPPSATAASGPPHPDRAYPAPSDLPGEGWQDALLSARRRLLKGRSSAKSQAVTIRHDVVDEVQDLGAATAKAPQAARPPRDSYEPEPGAATAEARQAARPPRNPYEPEPGAATAEAPPAARPPRNPYDREPGATIAKAPQAARPPPRDSYEPERGAATAEAPQVARPRRNSYESEPEAATVKAPQTARPPRNSNKPEADATTAKAPQAAPSPRDPYEPQAGAAIKARQVAPHPRHSYEPQAAAGTAKARQVTAPPRDPHEPQAGAARAKARQAAPPQRGSYEPQAGAATVKVRQAPPPPRDSYEPQFLEEDFANSLEFESHVNRGDSSSVDYDTQDERDLEFAYGPNDEQPVAASTPRHARRRTVRTEEHKRKRASLSYLTRLLVVLLILAGLVAAVSWQWSTVADLYQYLGRNGQRLQSQVSGESPSAKPEFWPRVPKEQTSGQAPGLAAPDGQTAPAVASLIEADPSAPKGKRYVGSVIWRTETISAGPGVAPELGVRADIEIPERRMTMTWSIRRNTDKTLPASHTVEMAFNLPADFSGGSIANIAAIVMKQSEEERGSKLVTRVAKVTNGLFLIGLSAVDADVQRDTQLLKDRPWFDVGIVYTSGNYAILALEKGEAGNRAFAQAFASWDKK